MTDLLIFTALTEEAQVVRAVLDKIAVPVEEGRVRMYDLPGNDSHSLRVGVASAHAMGARAMGVFASQVLGEVNPRLATLVGIAASAGQSSVELGDVPFSSHILAYDDMAVEKGVLTFRTEGFQVDSAMRQAAGELRTSLKAYSSWQKECVGVINDLVLSLNQLRRKQIQIPGNLQFPHLIVDVTAGGPFLLRDRDFRDSLRTLPTIPVDTTVQVSSPLHPKLVSLEMESHGFMGAAHELRVPAAVIKGISDVGDDEKAELEKRTGGFFRAYACSNALLAALYILRLRVASDPKRNSHIGEQQIRDSVSRANPVHVPKTFGDRVAETYRLMHYDVEQGRTFSGRRVGLFLRGQFGDLQVQRLVECIPESVTQAHIDSLTVTLRLASKEFPTIHGTIVSGTSFNADIVAQAEAEGIQLTSIAKLDTQLFDGQSYCRDLIKNIESNDKYNPALYIRPLIGNETSGDAVQAEDILDIWLSDMDWNQLTLLGDVGTGKTFLSRMLVQRLAHAHLADPLAHPMPVFIDLRNADRQFSLEGLVATHLLRHGLGRMTFDLFQHALVLGRIVLVLDGFDEMAARVTHQVTAWNFEELARCVRGRAKVLLTCRTHYFKSRSHEEEVILGGPAEYEPEIAGDLYWDLITRRGFRIAYLRPFDSTQIEQYIQVARPHDARETIKKIRGIYDLMELSRRPMLLDMIVRSIDRLNGTTVNAAALYQVFTSIWSGRDRWRDILTPIQKNAILTSLAFRLWVSGSSAIHYHELFQILGQQSNQNSVDLARIVDLDNEVRTASFLIRNDAGNYSFAHKSYAEFFVARHLAAELEAGKIECLDQPHEISPEIIGFLRDLLKDQSVEERMETLLTNSYRPRLSENTLRCLYGLRYGRWLREEAQGSIRIPMPRGMKLEGAQLSGVTLVGIDARAADFSGANLSNAVLMRSQLDDANMSGADLRSSDLREASLVRARLVSVQFMEANLESCDLLNADISQSNWRDAILTHARNAPPIVTAQSAIDHTSLDPAQEARTKYAAIAPIVHQICRQVARADGVEFDELRQRVALKLFELLLRKSDALGGDTTVRMRFIRHIVLRECATLRGRFSREAVSLEFGMDDLGDDIDEVGVPEAQTADANSVEQGDAFSSVSTPLDELLASEVRTQLFAVSDTWSPKAREVWLRWLNGESLDETAKQVGMELYAAQKLLSRLKLRVMRNLTIKQG